MMEEDHIGPDSEKKAAELLDEHNPDLAIVTFHRIGKVAMIDFRAAEDGKEAKALLMPKLAVVHLQVAAFLHIDCQPNQCVHHGEFKRGMTFGVYTNMDSTFSKAMWEALVEHFTAIHGEDAAERMATLKADIQAEETAMLVEPNSRERRQRHALAQRTPHAGLLLELMEHASLNVSDSLKRRFADFIDARTAN